MKPQKLRRAEANNIGESVSIEHTMLHAAHKHFPLSLLVMKGRIYLLQVQGKGYYIANSYECHLRVSNHITESAD